MISPAFTTLRQFFRLCYKPLRLRGKSVDSTRLHEITLNNFAKFLDREARIDDLTSDVIGCFLAWMLDRGRQAITVNDNRNRLMALARFAVRKGYLAEEPDVEPENEPERVVRAWLTVDLEALFAACAAQDGMIGGIPAALWWVGLHLVCLFTGERIRAVLSLRWEQVDLAAGWLVLTAEQRKGSRRDKEWQLPEVTIAALRGLKAKATGPLVFERDFCMGTVYNRYSRILDSAGLPSDRQSKFHRMRKSTASHFAAAGGNATALLDHSSARVTAKYLDKRIVKEQSAADLLTAPDAAIAFMRLNRVKDPE